MPRIRRRWLSNQNRVAGKRFLMTIRTMSWASDGGGRHLGLAFRWNASRCTSLACLRGCIVYILLVINNISDGEP